MPRAHVQTRPCPVCGVHCEVKWTKKRKPYWQCDECGVQVFVRRQAGIARFERPRQGQDEELFG